ncbi:MAG TPA: glycosyltransferase family 4 protein [Puia sp.]|nr:glycosyltransferase family 4 protein [Puia sp.]
MKPIKKIKILECIRQGQIGGGESHLLSLVENLDRNRFEPIVLSFTDGPMISRLKAMGAKVRVIQSKIPFDILRWKKVAEFIKSESVDLVHAHGTRACSNIAWATKSLKIPIVYTIHGWSFHADQNELVKRIRILGERYLTRTANVNISVSVSNQQTGKDHIKNFQSQVINNGIDHNRFCPSHHFRNIRDELGISVNDTLVLFIARFTAHKQPLTLIKAFMQAIEKFPCLHLLMVGDGDQKEEALRLVEEKRLGGKISFQPFRQDVPDILAAADIFILPSLWEGLPIGLIEAMAMGKAVVATNVDGTREVLEHEKNGLMTNPGNENELTSAIIRLAADPELRQKFRQEAIETVASKFNAAEMTKKIEAVYIDLLK